MTAPPRPRTRLPLPVWAGVSCACAALFALLTVAIGLAALGRFDRPAALLVLAGGAAGSAPSLAAALAARRLATAIRVLRRDALRRLSDPAAPSRLPLALPVLAEASPELLELARTLDALQLRVRMADEVADRHRRTAQTASAGMFELLSGLVGAEETARGQLSAELHDTAAQSFMLARSHLAAATRDRRGLDRRELAAVADLVDEAEEQVRAVMAHTRPPALRTGDLATAVAELRDDLCARYALDVRFAWPTSPHPLPLVTAVTVYRFFQEALLNVVKHADADMATARLDVTDDEVTATVTDEGSGFDPATVRPDRGRHVGLDLLRERARLAGGSLEVRSRPGRGTTVTLRIPRAGPPVSVHGLRRSA